MNRIHLPLGILPPSFGRLCDVMSALELNNLKTGAFDRHSKLSFLVDQITWIQPNKIDTKDSNRIKFPNFSFVLNYIKHSLNISSSAILLQMYRIGTKLNRIIEIPSVSDFEPFAYSFYRLKNPPSQLLKYLQTQNTNEFSDFLLSLEINLNRLILIYTRDGEFDQFQYGRKMINMNYRNSNIDIFIESINVLLDLGYSVVRIGRTNQKINFFRKGFYDYATSEKTSGINDFYLWSMAKAVISSGGGATQPAFIFKIPILFVNFGDSIANLSNLNNSNIYIFPKKYINASNKTTLGSTHIQELDIFQWKIPYNDVFFESKNLLLIDQNEKDITDCVLDFMEIVTSKFSDSSRKWPKYGQQNIYYKWLEN